MTRTVKTGCRGELLFSPRPPLKKEGNLVGLSPEDMLDFARNQESPGGGAPIG
jgi:hypothetical protein